MVFHVLDRGVARMQVFDADLVERAEEWRWGSLWRRCSAQTEEEAILTTSPVELPNAWVERLNRADNEKELKALRRSVRRRRAVWRARMATAHSETPWPGVRLSVIGKDRPDVFVVQAGADYPAEVSILL
jgi:hypothetical protein